MGVKLKKQGFDQITFWLLALFFVHFSDDVQRCSLSRIFTSVGVKLKKQGSEHLCTKVHYIAMKAFRPIDESPYHHSPSVSFFVTSAFRQFGGKRVYLYTLNSNQLDPFASKLTKLSVLILNDNAETLSNQPLLLIENVMNVSGEKS